MKLTVRKQLFLFAIFMIVFQLVLNIFFLKSLSGIKDNITSVFTKRLPSINKLVQADRDFQQALVAERSLLLKNHSQETKKVLAKDYHTNMNQVGERFQAYKKIAETPKEKELIKKFESSFENWVSNSNRLIGIDDSGEFADRYTRDEIIKNSFGEVNQNFEQARGHLDHLQEEILSLGETEFTAAMNNYDFSFKLVIMLGTLSLIGTLFISWLVARGVSGKLEKVVSLVGKENIELNKISTDLSHKSTTLASTSQEQAAGVTETSSSLHEISQMITNNTQNVERADQLILESQKLIELGHEKLNELQSMMNNVEQSSVEMVAGIDRGNIVFEQVLSTFESIKDKTTMINDIVFQTKLLSFNASVEAARAGEHGKGFSIVAEEVGALAQQSGQSAVEISDVLEESISNISNLMSKSKSDLASIVEKNKGIILKSVECTQDCKSTFSQVSEKFENVSKSSVEIREAAKEQQVGVEEINSAMREIDSSNALTSQSAAEIELSAGNLAKIVSHISDNINSLKELVGQIDQTSDVSIDVEQPDREDPEDDFSMAS